MLFKAMPQYPKQNCSDGVLMLVGSPTTNTRFLKENSKDKNLEHVCKHIILVPNNLDG